MTTRGNQNILCFIAAFILAISNRYRTCSVNTGTALQTCHLVLLEQKINSRCQIADNSVFRCHHLRQIQLYCAGLDTKIVQRITCGIGKMFRCVQQCLGRNTAHIQTSATQRLTSVNTGNIHTQLCGAN